MNDHGMTEQEEFLQLKTFDFYLRSFYYVFLTITSVGYGDNLSMPGGFINPKDYFENPDGTINYDEIHSGYGTDRLKLMFTIIISYIAFNYFVARIPGILDSI